MNTMHLFAGGGGGMYADLILGHNPIVAVEWEKAACDVLRARKEEWWPDCEIIEGDIRAFSGVQYAGKVDCIHAGFPCQDLSVAGKRAGLDGDRSSLYVEALRIFREVRPRYLFLENVTGITSANGGEALNRVMSDLAEIGLDARWTCLRASDVGANHRRDRWWCLATRRISDTDNGYELANEALRARRDAFESGGANDKRRPSGERDSEGLLGPDGVRRADDSGGKEERAEVADAQRTERGALHKDSGMEGQFCVQPENGGENASRSGGSRKDAAHAGGKGLPTPARRQERSVREEERAFQGCEPLRADTARRSYWSIEPPLGRVANGVAQRVNRLKMLGNGQVPLQAAYAWVMLGGPHNLGGI